MTGKQYVVVRGLNWKRPCEHPPDECECVEKRWEPGDKVTASDFALGAIPRTLRRGVIADLKERVSRDG